MKPPATFTVTLIYGPIIRDWTAPPGFVAFVTEARLAGRVAIEAILSRLK